MTYTPILHVGDTSPALTGTCQSTASDGTVTAADLTGATLSVHVQPPSGTVITRAGSIVSATAGTWSMAWQTGDLVVPGSWSVEVQVTWSGGTVQTFGPAPFTVVDQIA